jgi:DNA-binding transcriptional MocR family regulator
VVVAPSFISLPVSIDSFYRTTSCLPPSTSLIHWIFLTSTQVGLKQESLQISKSSINILQFQGLDNSPEVYSLLRFPYVTLISLQGLPNNAYFPFDTLEAQVALPDRWQPSGDKSKSKNAPPEAHLLVPHYIDTPDPTKKLDLATALQYGVGQGMAPLYSFLKDFTLNYLHNSIPYKGGADIILTCGNTDGFFKTLQCFTNDWVEGRDPIEGKEGIFVEETCYTPPVTLSRSKGLNIVTVALDDQGMVANGPGGLKEILDSWDLTRGKRPHLLYTVSIGHNPTGIIIGMDRRREIYAICHFYDIIIIEDEPYWYLQYPSTRKATVPKPKKPTGIDFLDSGMPSYLSIDVDGRVVRLDTFSKIVAPGSRMGWLTAQPSIIERIQRLTESSTQEPSGFVQSMIAELLIGPDHKAKGKAAFNGWDISGWIRWLEGLRGEYERRMNTFCDVLDEECASAVQISQEKSAPVTTDYDWTMTRNTVESTVSGPRYGGTISIRIKPSLNQPSCPTCSSDPTCADDAWSVVERTSPLKYSRPEGGWFIWMEILFDIHPLIKTVAGQKLATALWVLLAQPPFKLLIAPGAMFSSSPEIALGKGWRYFRVCFASAEKEQLGDMAKRLCAGIQAFFEITDADEIEELLKDFPAAESGSLETIEGMGVLTGVC